MSSGVMALRGVSSVREIVRQRAWAISVWAGMAVWTTVLFVVVRDAYASFRLGRFDLGNMVQTVWSTAHGHPLEMTYGPTSEQGLRLAVHADPFLALLTPLWVIWPSPLALAFAQIAVVALGALPVFWLARRRTGSEHLGGLLALAYLAYPWVATSAAGAIHPVTFAITFLLFCIWFLETDRLVLFVMFALLTMSTGELMGLPIAGLGVWYALARGRRLAGGAVAVLGLAWTALAIYVIVPASAGGHSVYYGFYDQVGGSPMGVAKTLLTDPRTIFNTLVEGHDIAYLILLGLPLLFLFVLSPALAAVALPQLLANWLSDFRSMTDPRYHSVAAVIPFLIAATVFGIAHIGVQRRGLAAAGILVCSATLAIVVGPWARAVGAIPLGGVDVLASTSDVRVAALADAVAVVPSGVPVAASNTAGGHLSARRHIYSVPMLGRAEWVVIDQADPWIVRRDSPILTKGPQVVRRLVARLRRDPAWTTAFERHGVVVFRRARS